MKMDKDDLQVALNEARDCLKTLNDKIGRDQFRFGFQEFRPQISLFIYFHLLYSPPPGTTGSDRTGTTEINHLTTAISDPANARTKEVVAAESDRGKMSSVAWSREIAIRAGTRTTMKWCPDRRSVRGSPKRFQGVRTWWQRNRTNRVVPATNAYSEVY